ncbi:MAG TPA: divergent polysaccharide deacetylase family protein [Rhizomicrobium sp.]|nr:divergent polysaccharide deacetylase family protein [Rhizomicrobium sp.]
MIRESLIRRLPDIACVVLFGAGLALCGDAALAGLPKFMDAVVPGMAAQAGVSGGPSQDTAHFALSEGFAPSRHAPQVLYPMPDWLVDAIQVQKVGVPPVLRGQRPVIAICIDDLGEDIAGTDKAMALPKDVALSFLPYAESTPFLAQAASRKGHLILAHVPMQALGARNPEPMALKTGMAGDEIARILGWNLARVQGLVGINNHEGSRFTADAAALAPVMATLKARRLFFFDSRTGPTSAVGKTARAHGVMTAERDIFLDDDPEPAAVAAQLEMLARMAKRNGVAIAIGHPKDATLRLLKAWLAQDHGVTLVPLDVAMRMKAERTAQFAAR